ncbi:MAG: glycoside hydrolase family 43 protein [Anaerolineae bacterium]
MLLNTQINIRDPFVLPHTADEHYYLYGTRGSEVWADTATGIDYYTSHDLQNWQGPFLAFDPPTDFWSDRNYWAPEVHAYRGQYYMFATFKAEGVCRGTQILRADSPAGPFLPISDGPVTPSDWECLDGTLFVDADDTPWIVFCHEWVQVGDGEICALRLSNDLTCSVGEPQLLFRASSAPWSQEINSKGRRGYVTDGPSLYQSGTGTLWMLWSSFSNGAYAVGMARFASGDILGAWDQLPKPLYAGDGGHCMIFETFEGQLMLALHRPNATPHERPYFIPLVDTGTSLDILAEPT